VSINGTTFLAAGDVDLSAIMSNYEVEGIPTSGNPVFKYTKRTQTVTGNSLILGGDELEELRNVADSQTEVTLAFTVAQGNAYQSTGRIMLNEWTTAENRCDVDMIPSAPWAYYKA
jgi:hypothetical protein